MSDLLSGGDILGLITALIEGAFEAPQWGTFLERLRVATGADNAVLVVHPPGRPMDDGLLIASGSPQGPDLAALYREFLYPSGLGPRRWPDEGTPLTLEDVRSASPSATDAHRELVERHGIVASRQIRVTELHGVEAWLLITCRQGAFSDQHTSLLAALAAPLRGVLHSHVVAERGRFEAAMAAEAVRRLQCGWLLLDQGGHVLASDRHGDAILAGSGVLSRNASGRLTVRPGNLEREILNYIAQIASGRSTRPRAISLRTDPWLDMLIVKARESILSDTAVPAVIAYVHGDNWRSADRCGQLCDLFDLSPSEAKLALALCRGRGIADAATELGLALETARSYSKAIYAKTGTRGMADLVRLIMGSVLTLAPDT